MKIATVLCVAVTLFLAGCGKGGSDQQKTQVAAKVAKQFALEAYTMWARDNTSMCPGDINELLKYMNANDAKDPWGNDYKLLCGEGAPAESGGVGVQSAGPDGTFGNGDDVKSW